MRKCPWLHGSGDQVFGLKGQHGQVHGGYPPPGLVLGLLGEQDATCSGGFKLLGAYIGATEAVEEG